MRPSQKDLFEECSRTQLRVKDDEIILPRGITGFWGTATAPPPHLDEKAFCQMCYSIAMENGGTVTELDTDTYPRNFYSAQIRRHDDAVFILQWDAASRFVLISPPDWLQLPDGPVRVLSPNELNQDWHGLCEELSPEELEQIRYWNPQTVGEIVFNTWD